MTPILNGQESQLRAYLEGFTQQTSPFASLTQTHFARWVILEDWVNEPLPAPPGSPRLRVPHLHQHLRRLAGQRPRRALPARRRCRTSGVIAWAALKPAAGDTLKAYLLHNQIDIGFFVAAYPDAISRQGESKSRPA